MSAIPVLNGLHRVNMKLAGKKIYLDLLTPEKVTMDYVRWMNDRELTRFMESRFKDEYSLEELKTYIREINDGRTNFMFGIYLMADDRYIGNIKLCEVNPFPHHADIGFIIRDQASWGKGIGSEAIGLVTRFAFDRLGLNKVVAGMYQSNIGSLKAFTKNGFRQTGVFEKQYCYKGRYEDAYWLEKLNPSASNGCP